jgi:hypothetical protein
MYINQNIEYIIYLFAKGVAYIMAKKSFFGNKITPSCSYCKFGNKSKEGNKVLCEKQGLVDADFACKKWDYDPIKRVPKKQLNIPNQEDDII